MKRKLSILFLLILSLSVFMGTVSMASEITSDLITSPSADLTVGATASTYYQPIYELSEDGTYYIVVGFESSDIPTEDGATPNTVDIPETYNGLPIKQIKDDAFLNLKNIKTVKINANISFIANGTIVNFTQAMSSPQLAFRKTLSSENVDIWGYSGTNIKKYTFASSATDIMTNIGKDFAIVEKSSNTTPLFVAPKQFAEAIPVKDVIKFKGEDVFVFEDENGNKTYLTSNLEDVTEEYIKSATWSKIWIFSGSGLAAAVVIAVYCTCNCLCKKKKEELPPPDGERPNPPDSDDPNPPDDGRPTPPLPEYPSPGPELPIPPPVIEEPEEPKEPPRDKPTPPPHNPPVPPQKPRPPMYGCILTIIISITFIFSIGAPYLSLIHDTSMWVPATISSASAILILGMNMVSNSVGALDKFIPYRRGASSFISLFASFFILGSLGYWHPGWSMTIIATIVASLTIVFTVFLPKVFIKIAYFRIGISLFLLFTGILFSFGIMGMWKTGLIIYAIGCAISIIALILEFIFKKFILKSLTMRI